MSNIDVIRKRLTEESIKIETKLLEVCIEVAEDLIYWIEGSGSIPVATGNLQDSTGVGVYMGGVLYKYIPTQLAQVSRESKWGTDELSLALEMGATAYNEGVWIVIFSTMPYSEKLDNRTNFFSGGLKDDLLTGIKQRLVNGITYN